MPKRYREVHQKFIKLAQEEVGEGGLICRKHAKDIAERNGMRRPSWLFNDRTYRAGRGQYNLPVLTVDNTVTVAKAETEEKVEAKEESTA